MKREKKALGGRKALKVGKAPKGILDRMEGEVLWKSHSSFQLGAIKSCDEAETETETELDGQRVSLPVPEGTGHQVEEYVDEAVELVAKVRIAMREKSDGCNTLRENPIELTAENLRKTRQLIDGRSPSVSQAEEIIGEEMYEMVETVWEQSEDREHTYKELELYLVAARAHTQHYQAVINGSTEVYIDDVVEPTVTKKEQSLDEIEISSRRCVLYAVIKSVSIRIYDTEVGDEWAMELA